MKQQQKMSHCNNIIVSTEPFPFCFTNFPAIHMFVRSRGFGLKRWNDAHECLHKGVCVCVLHSNNQIKSTCVSVNVFRRIVCVLQVICSVPKLRLNESRFGTVIVVNGLLGKQENKYWHVIRVASGGGGGGGVVCEYVCMCFSLSIQCTVCTMYKKFICAGQRLRGTQEIIKKEMIQKIKRFCT